MMWVDNKRMSVFELPVNMGVAMACVYFDIVMKVLVMFVMRVDVYMLHFFMLMDMFNGVYTWPCDHCTCSC